MSTRTFNSLAPAPSSQQLHGAWESLLARFKTFTGRPMHAERSWAELIDRFDDPMLEDVGIPEEVRARALARREARTLELTLMGRGILHGPGQFLPW